jgi:hypothetical protein
LAGFLAAASGRFPPRRQPSSHPKRFSLG